jgi:hypothetical protein
MEQGSLHVVRRSDKIKITNPLSMGADYFNTFKVVDDIINSTLGIPDFTAMAGTHRKSASEASFIQGDATVRRNYFLNIVKDFVLTGIEKQFSLKQQFMDEKEVIKASGELLYQTFTASKEDIQGEFQFDFDVDSMAATNSAELQNLTNLLQIQASNEILHPTLKMMNPDKLTRYLYKKGGVNVDQFMSTEIEEEVVFSPERENEIAERGDLMPNPKKGENHEQHLNAHKEFVKQRVSKLGQGAVEDSVINRVIEHIALTEMLANEAKGQKAPAPQPQQAPEMMTQPEVLEPEGQVRPLQ